MARVPAWGLLYLLARQLVPVMTHRILMPSPVPMQGCRMPTALVIKDMGLLPGKGVGE